MFPSNPNESVKKRSAIYRTLDAEVSIDQLEVTGQIPSWLEGSLFRNGPAKFEAGDQDLNHWFDGYAMLHLFTVNGGSVGYKNKFLESDAYTHAENGEMHYTEFGTDPCRDIFERFFTYFKPPEATDNANVNVAKIAGEFVALTETPLPVEFDPDTLETLGISGYDEAPGQITSAHPHYDPKHESTVSYAMDFGWENTYKIFRIPDETGQETVFGRADAGNPSYMHSFGMTENYILLVEFPLVINPLDVALGNSPLIESFEWEPERGTRFTVFDRDTGEVIGRPRSEESVFAFHHVNSFERNSSIVADAICYPDADLIEEFYLDRIKSAEFSPPTGELRRFKINLSEGSVTSRVLSEDPIELPRINYERFNAREYQYVYGVGQHSEGQLDELIKIDVKNGESTTWREKGTFPGEPVFVEAPNSSDEDDGVVLSVVIDPSVNGSFLLLLDASTFEEIARADVPHVIPPGFHGQFYDE